MRTATRHLFIVAFLLMSALLATPAFSEDAQPSKEKKTKPIDRIKTLHVRSISHYYCDLTNGKTYKSYYYEYDRDARLLSSLKFNSNGTLAEKMVYEHGDARNITGVQYDSDGSVASRTEFKYDFNNNMIERAERSPRGDTRSKTVYVIGAADDVVEEIDYDASGRAVSRWRSEYATDASGRICGKTTFDRDGSVESRDVFVYDASGNMVEKIIAAPLPAAGDKISTVRQTYRYDANQNIVQITNYASDGRVTGVVKTVYRYF